MKLWRPPTAALHLWISHNLMLAQPEHALRVAVTNLFHVLFGEIKRRHHRDGRADVTFALLLVERTIGGKQHVIRSEERDSADRRRAGARERGVAVEVFEIVK